MFVLVLISFLIFVSYILSICLINKKIPIHLSESFFILKNKFIFTLFMFTIMILTLIPLLELIPKYQFLSFLTCGCIGFIGAAPNFFDDLEGKIHKISAIIAMIASQILVIICNPLILLSWIIILIVYKHIKQTLLFWIEIISFINIYILLFLMI